MHHKHSDLQAVHPRFIGAVPLPASDAGREPQIDLGDADQLSAMSRELGIGADVIREACKAMGPSIGRLRAHRRLSKSGR